MSGLDGSPLFAYVGLGPGQDFFQHFLTLLATAGAALLAIVQWPLLALFRRLTRITGSDGPVAGDAGSPPSVDEPSQT